ncbi:MAG: serine hydroxymethyltransferase [Dehalococcoidia bacterium]|nr:serine hydroxymethyltransferase [Dehalococcoidia bacterium]
MFEHLKKVDAAIAAALYNELEKQKSTINLIASENYASLAVLEAQGSLLTNKYAEGYPRQRYYGGCEFIDVAEDLAIERAKKLFQAEHANVQPHSGAQANMAAYYALMNHGDSIMAMSLANGGHLTHGSPVNFSGRFYNFVNYGVNRDTELLDYDELEKLAVEQRPGLIVAGASAYPRTLDFKRLRKMADLVGAKLMVDMAHLAGLIAAGLHPSPVPYADVVCSTTHKTLRGPRGGFILCRKYYGEAIDSAVFPGLQGGPLMHVIAAKAVCFAEALAPGFVTYQQAVLDNAGVLAGELQKKGLRLVAGGTDTHLLLADLSPLGITGKAAQEMLEKAGIIANKNAIPFDTRPPKVTSGIRLGTPAVTTRGMKGEDMKKLADLIVKVLSSPGDENTVRRVRDEVEDMCRRFPIPGFEGD